MLTTEWPRTWRSCSTPGSRAVISVVVDNPAAAATFKHYCQRRLIKVIRRFCPVHWPMCSADGWMLCSSLFSAHSAHFPGPPHSHVTHTHTHRVQLGSYAISTTVRSNFLGFIYQQMTQESSDEVEMLLQMQSVYSVQVGLAWLCLRVSIPLFQKPALIFEWIDPPTRITKCTVVLIISNCSDVCWTRSIVLT